MLNVALFMAALGAVLAIPVLFQTEQCALWLVKGPLARKSINVLIRENKFAIDLCGPMVFSYNTDTPSKLSIKFKQAYSSPRQCKPQKKELQDQITRLLLSMVNYNQVGTKSQGYIVYFANQRGQTLLAVTKRGEQPSEQLYQYIVKEDNSPNPLIFPTGNFMSFDVNYPESLVKTYITPAHIRYNMCGAEIKLEYKALNHKSITIYVSAEALNKCALFEQSTALLHSLKAVTAFSMNDDNIHVHLENERKQTLVKMRPNLEANVIIEPLV